MGRATCDLCKSVMDSASDTIELLERYHLHGVEIVCSKCHQEIARVGVRVDDATDQFVKRLKVRAVGAWFKKKLGMD